MNELLSTEEAVKHRLNIKDFRHLKKDQLIDFVTSLPDMDRDVAIACVQQFPHFKDYSLAIIDHFYDICESSIKEDGVHSIEAYETILDELRSLLKNRKMRKQERAYIIEKMIDVGLMIENVEDKKRITIQKVLRGMATVGSLALGLAGAVIGAKINLRKD